MTVTRSPAYPTMTVNQAIEYVSKVYEQNRTNPVAREAAAVDMGYAGLTGSSTKALADLTHYGLIDKAGKGTIRVSQRAVDLLYPESPEGKAAALNSAAFAPPLFAELRAQFHDGIPSENNLRSFLMRKGFATSAIPFVVNSYRETSRIVQEAGVNKSHVKVAPPVAESPDREQIIGTKMQTVVQSQEAPAAALQALGAPPLNRINMNIQGDKVHLEGLLDHQGILELEQKLKALKVLLTPIYGSNDTGNDD